MNTAQVIGESIKLLEDALKTLCECEISYGADDKVFKALNLLEKLQKEREMINTQRMECGFGVR